MAEEIMPKEEVPKAKGTKTKAKELTKDEVIAAIKGMTVLELSELIKALEEEFGVSAAAPVAMPAAPVPAAAPAAPAPPEEEEQKEFTVILKSFGESKINVIKAVREVTTLGLKEAKELVESAPKAVKEGISKAEAATLKEKLEAAGATIEVK